MEKKKHEDKSRQRVFAALKNIDDCTEELRSIFSSLDSLSDNEYTSNPVTSQAQGKEKMIASETMTEAVQVLPLNSPFTYRKLHCYVCEREWISDATFAGEVYRPPKECRFSDCRSTVWHDPVKGAARRIEWLKKRHGNVSAETEH